ncbi:MAG: hypothetical protein H3C30_18455 [Candidatus Hydrogenedentes bacterium]|nr:hypothetical protein [Candidatus Hydrogenedentota bacterium]
MGIFLYIKPYGRPLAPLVESWSAYIQALNIQYLEHHIVIPDDQSFCAAHFTCNDTLYTTDDQTHVLTGERANTVGFTFLQGYVWEKDADNSSNEALNAKSISQWLKHGDVENFRDSCNGEYSVVHGASDGTMVAFSDRLCVENIYYTEQNGLHIVSNRLRLIKEVLGTVDVNTENMVWLGMVGYIIGEGTSIKKVNRLPQGACIKIQGDTLSVQKRALFMYDPEIRKQAVSHLDHLLMQGIRECTRNVAVCLENVPGAPVPLSGGKDSRAVLGLILRAGGLEKITSFTNGFEEHPDVVVAKQIATYFGINHKINVTKPPTTLSSEDIFRKLAASVFQTDGMLGGFDARGSHSAENKLVYAGHVGEVYRGYGRKDADLSSVRAAAQMFHIIKLFDPANITNNECKHYFEKMLEERVHFYLDEGGALEDIPELIYTVERIPNWVGILRRHDGYSCRIINPLNTETFIRLSFALGRHQRNIERIHFEIIKHCNNWLVELPFANAKWDSRLGEYAESSDFIKEPVPVPPGIPTFGSWQTQLNDSVTLRKMIMDVISSYPQSPVWAYFDRNMVERSILKDRKSTHALIGLYGFLTLFFYQHGIEVPMKLHLAPKDRPLGKPTSIPIRPNGNNTLYVYNGALSKQMMGTRDDFVRSGLSRERIFETHPLAIRSIPGDNMPIPTQMRQPSTGTFSFLRNLVGFLSSTKHK